MNSQLSHAESEEQRYSQPKGPAADHRRVMLSLSACMALQMTSFVIILPLFARRFTELGAGVELLGISAMAYALAATLAAPFMGALADRYGRRRLVLISLATYILAFTGYRIRRFRHYDCYRTRSGRRIHCRPDACREWHCLRSGSARSKGAVDQHCQRRRFDWLDCRPHPGWCSLRSLGICCGSQCLDPDGADRLPRGVSHGSRDS